MYGHTPASGPEKPKPFVDRAEKVAGKLDAVLMALNVILPAGSDMQRTIGDARQLLLEASARGVRGKEPTAANR